MHDQGITPGELIRLQENLLTQERAAEVESHLAKCQDCQKESDRIRALTASFGELDEEYADVKLATRVRAAASAGAPVAARRKWWIPAAVAGAVVLCGLVVLLTHPWSQKTDSFRAKSASADQTGQRWTGLTVFRLKADGSPIQVGAQVTSGEELLFAYSNRDDRTYPYLMVFAVDPQGEVYWYYPANVTHELDPRALPIVADGWMTELPDRIRHRFPQGPVRLYGLFLHEPLQVSTVEKLIKDRFQSGLWKSQSRLPLEGTAQHILELQVTP